MKYLFDTLYVDIVQLIHFFCAHSNLIRNPLLNAHGVLPRVPSGLEL